MYVGYKDADIDIDDGSNSDSHDDSNSEHVSFQGSGNLGNVLFSIM